jgi:hypothetical protein
MTAETTIRLAKANERIIGMKEASGNFSQCMHIIKEKPAGFLVISGDDIITLAYDCIRNGWRDLCCCTSFSKNIFNYGSAGIARKL